MSDEHLTTDLRIAVLQQWDEASVLDEGRYLDKLLEQVRQAEEHRQRLVSRLEVIQRLVQSGDEAVAWPAAQELGYVREQLDRAAGKVEKLERDATDVRARVARWKALRRWASR